MANSQLTAYVSAQLDKGVARDAITQALVGAGWMQADVDAALSEVMASRATSPVTATPATAAAASTTMQPAMGMSASPAMGSPMAASSMSTSAANTPVTPAAFFSATPATTAVGAEITESPRRSLTWVFVLAGILIALALVGGGTYYYFMGGQSTDLSQLNPINNTAAQDLATAQQERDQLRAEVGTLSASVSDLENQLSFFQTTTTTSTVATVKGTLGTTTTNTWILTTSRNVVITVSNSKDAAVAAALLPLKGAEVELTGTHAPVSALLKVTVVNGTAVTAVVPAATSTPATSTPR